jgi:hypothetical protein
MNKASDKLPEHVVEVIRLIQDKFSNYVLTGSASLKLLGLLDRDIDNDLDFRLIGGDIKKEEITSLINDHGFEIDKTMYNRYPNIDIDLLFLENEFKKEINGVIKTIKSSPFNIIFLKKNNIRIDLFKARMELYKTPSYGEFIIIDNIKCSHPLYALTWKLHGMFKWGGKHIEKHLADFQEMFTKPEIIKLYNYTTNKKI